MINEEESDSQKIFSVTELNKIVKNVLQHNFQVMWIKGEISNFIAAASGHWYFSLKDSEAQVRCAMFRGSNNKIDWIPKNGDQIEVKGQVGLYEVRGEYQLNIEYIQRAGIGALFEKFNQLKNKLDVLGLFDITSKNPITAYPSSIGVITSPDGAALRDVISTLRRRNKSVSIIVYPTLVQGDAAPEGIIKALKIANTRNEVDTIILCRGGGSIEDLWAFNSEDLAFEIFNSTIPIISAIGHETDFTISDFVSDIRAATPTAAAELISENLEQVVIQIEVYKKSMSNIINEKLQSLSQKIDMYEKRLVSPSERLLMQLEVTRNLRKRLKFNFEKKLEAYKNKIDGLQKNLLHLDPNSILLRGYSIIFDQNKNIINSSSNVASDDKISIKFHHGSAQAKIIDPLIDNIE
ncbi:exodeoxyribonuclease VII large subunit [Methylophilaceae bacterium]|jgi:exodeoxyribonuclease VII large subunit|nr:exodeoxyribonuclease VII large subunit [Methylophilaceae bacterium]